jgi:hypothetical protein
MRVFYIMGNHRLYKTKCFHVIVTLESERPKVAALNLWEASRFSFGRPLPGKPSHPTASPPFPKSGFFHIVTQSLKGGDGGELSGQQQG